MRRMFQCAALALGFLAPLTAVAQSSGMKPAAVAPFQKGVAAARQKDWKDAVQDFLDAQAADPDASQIWFNLGLAETKLPGYEFRAIAWFKAYLLSNPNAANADAVRKQIVVLDASYEEQLRQTIEPLAALAKSIADVTGGGITSPAGTEFGTDERANYASARRALGGNIASMYLFLGDVDRADATRKMFNIIGQYDESDFFSRPYPSALASGLASTGHFGELFHYVQNSSNPKMILFYNWVQTSRSFPIVARYAMQSGRFDVALWAINDAKSRQDLNCAKFEQLGADDSGITQTLYSTTCSGWWLKKGDVAWLLERGRNGVAITQFTDTMNRDGSYQVVAEFSDTTRTEFIAAIKNQLSDRVIRNRTNRVGNGLTATDYTLLFPSLDSLTDLFDAYRQMHGPFGG